MKKKLKILEQISILNERDSNIEKITKSIQEEITGGSLEDFIRKFGFEDIHTIIFCGMCERADVPLNSIYETYDEYMSLDIMLDE